MSLGLFPLNLVLFPWAQLPLHIYEPRFRQLISECITDGRAFGVNFIEGSHMHAVGCTARVTQVSQRYPDGRLDIIVQGSSRYRVLDVSSDAAPYIIADVDAIEDEPHTVDPLLAEQCALKFNTIIELVYGADGPMFDPALRPDVPASFLMAPKAGMDNSQKQSLIEMTSEVERLEYLHDHLAAIIPSVQKAELTQRIIQNDGYLAPEDPA